MYLQQFSEKIAVTEIFDLSQPDIMPDLNWHSLICAWKKTNNVREKISILHEGYKANLDRLDVCEPIYDDIDRHVFYFQIAEHWNNPLRLRLPNDEGVSFSIGLDKNYNKVIGEPYELRTDIARKAFGELAINFFKKTLESKEERFSLSGFNHEWQTVFNSRRLFLMIQHFFRPEEDCGRFIIRNLASSRKPSLSHFEALAIDFLLKMAEFMWLVTKENKKYCFHNDQEGDKIKPQAKKLITAAMPWMIEILDFLNRLDVIRPYLLDLELTCLRKLRQIAMRSKLKTFMHPVYRDREVEDGNIDEACYAGSEAACLLVLRKHLDEEHKRLKGVLEQDIAIDEAETKKRLLTKK